MKKREVILRLGAATSPMWVKPVLDSVLLPAHAQCSPTAGNPTGQCTTVCPDSSNPNCDDKDIPDDPPDEKIPPIDPEKNP